jgi:hypothetical protein
MAFTFIHTADWQLGAQFGTLPIDIAARLQAARLDVIDRIAALATCWWQGMSSTMSGHRNG